MCAQNNSRRHCSYQWPIIPSSSSGCGAPPRCPARSRGRSDMLVVITWAGKFSIVVQSKALEYHRELSHCTCKKRASGNVHASECATLPRPSNPWRWQCHGQQSCCFGLCLLRSHLLRCLPCPRPRHGVRTAAPGAQCPALTLAVYGRHGVGVAKHRSGKASGMRLNPSGNPKRPQCTCTKSVCCLRMPITTSDTIDIRVCVHDDPTSPAVHAQPPQETGSS
jgi:hypothetical protein